MFSCNILPHCVFFLLFSFEIPDYALEKHTLVTALVLDEFECQLSCLSNDTCQSFNVHPNKRNRTRICDLNSNTRQKKTDDFKRGNRFSSFDNFELRSIFSQMEYEQLTVFFFIETKCTHNFTIKLILMTDMNISYDRFRVP